MAEAGSEVVPFLHYTCWPWCSSLGQVSSAWKMELALLILCQLSWIYEAWDGCEDEGSAPYPNGSCLLFEQMEPLLTGNPTWAWPMGWDTIPEKGHRQIHCLCFISKATSSPWCPRAAWAVSPHRGAGWSPLGDLHAKASCTTGCLLSCSGL